MTKDYFSGLFLPPDPARPVPVYCQLAESLAHFIGANGVPAGVRLPGVEELAASAKVSVGTMEKALQSLIADGVCSRRPKRGTFVGAAPPPGHKRRVAGLMSLPPLSDGAPIHARILAGIHAAAGEMGVELTSVNAGDPAIAQFASDPAVEWLGVLLIYWFHRSDVEAALAKDPRTRYVFVNYDFGSATTASERLGAVLNDDFAGGFELGMALRRRGHRHIAVLSNELDDCNYLNRIAGLEAVGKIFHDPAWQVTVRSIPAAETTLPQEEVGRRLARAALRETPAPTAIVALNDLMAFGAAEVAASRVEVAGYDHVMPELSRLGRFSTVEIDFFRIGYLALKLIAGAFPAASRIIRVAPRLLTQWQSPGAEHEL